MRAIIFAALALLIGVADASAQRRPGDREGGDRPYDRERPYEGDRDARRDRDRDLYIVSHPDMGERCVDVAGWDFAPGGKLHMWDCHGSPNQRFEFDRREGTFRIRDFCLEAFGGRAGDRVGLARCDRNEENQRWRVRRDRRYFEIVGANDLCLDINFADRKRGAGLIVWNCHGRDNQRWSFYDR